ncbi:hypothetical protein MKW98_002024 [Papaver atlanticum]|uniref:Uncharacterized protein n=1 Tax=Papaver atlanticum TaxID=357466 RepID=A0AAD4SPF7_9MAGN|nr:hypothetical protein MKW98_002024 [Papaver atlanticum]
MDVFLIQIILLMASALNMSTLAFDGGVDSSYNELHSRQLSIAMITKMIHMAVLAGDVLLARAYVDLASLGNSEVVALISRSVQHLVTGETMQMTAASEQRCSMEYYMKKTYNKTAALISNSCQAVSINSRGFDVSV